MTVFCHTDAITGQKWSLAVVKHVEPPVGPAPLPAAAPAPATAAVPSEGRTTGGWVMFGLAAAALAAALGFALTRGDGTPPPQAGIETRSPGAGIAAMEARSLSEPDNAGVWVQLAELRFDARDYDGATVAYRRASQLSPAVAAVWSGLGEAMVMATPRNAPPMPDAALAAFRRANSLDRSEPRARYFLAVKRDIEGDHTGAITDWLALLADTPSGAPWEPDLRRTIEQVGARHNIPVAPRLAAVRQRSIRPDEMPVAVRVIPGPTRQQIQDAAALPKRQQDVMIEGMVNSLEARLAREPNDVDGWITLMRSRMTLGQTAQAATALQSATRANPAASARLEEQAQMLGVPQT